MFIIGSTNIIVRIAVAHHRHIVPVSLGGTETLRAAFFLDDDNDDTELLGLEVDCYPNYASEQISLVSASLGSSQLTASATRFTPHYCYCQE